MQKDMAIRHHLSISWWTCVNAATIRICFLLLKRYVGFFFLALVHTYTFAVLWCCWLSFQEHIWCAVCRDFISDASGRLGFVFGHWRKSGYTIAKNSCSCDIHVCCAYWCLSAGWIAWTPRTCAGDNGKWGNFTRVRGELAEVKGPSFIIIMIRWVGICKTAVYHHSSGPTDSSSYCRLTNYELLRWLVETPSRDFAHYRLSGGRS